MTRLKARINALDLSQASNSEGVEEKGRLRRDDARRVNNRGGLMRAAAEQLYDCKINIIAAYTGYAIASSKKCSPNRRISRGSTYCPNTSLEATLTDRLNHRGATGYLYLALGATANQEHRIARGEARIAELQNRVAEAEEDAKGASQQARFALAAAGEIGQLGGKRVLWVDDEPQNNQHGINALQAQGVDVITSKTTREALEQVHMGKFDVIITDQLRYEDGIRKDRAGYDLIDRLQQEGVKVPVILSTAYPNIEEAHNLGFYDAAATQQDIFKLAMKAIQCA